jgi:uncharacterized protein with NRDE domain
MCLLALYFRVAEDAPVVVGANREEFYARGGSPPRLLPGPLPALAGLDPAAGGTWLGVNAGGLLVAVTNRPRSRPPGKPRSRGLLVRDLLTLPDARTAADVAARELGGDRYLGCNLLCADAERAVVLQAGDWLRVRPLPPGIHVLGNGDVNDDGDARVTFARVRLAEGPQARAADCVAGLRRLCPLHEPPDEPICFRAPLRGTVSSSILALTLPPRPNVYLHAQGPPDVTPYADLSGLLDGLRRSDG